MFGQPARPGAIIRAAVAASIHPRRFFRRPSAKEERGGAAKRLLHFSFGGVRARPAGETLMSSHLSLYDPKS